MSSILDNLTCQTDSPLKNCVFYLYIEIGHNKEYKRQKENGNTYDDTIFNLYLYLIYLSFYVKVHTY
ncbi:hypothetical protein SCAPIOD180021 [Staphylococcus capitis]|nr:hypothetical protein CR01_180021 [Staphylococcus capitis CR01]CQD26573.1 hypothetical protein SCAPIOD120092 [Staphylococcus capitis]CQD27488.1 hypothetical protein SCAPIOD180021 [Staphylococcus capitis]CQD31112.1 hypothetical protein SCAPIOD150025 [Staphylococcus capitis]CRN11151.1 hypothetical protein BN1517170021 [Staphylococcus capitis]